MGDQNYCKHGCLDYEDCQDCEIESLREEVRGLEAENELIAKNRDYYKNTTDRERDNYSKCFQEKYGLEQKLAEAEKQAGELEEKYYEILYTVISNSGDNESRHDAAIQIIKNYERNRSKSNNPLKGE